MTGRGALNEDIQKIAKSKLGREISLKELRLMPYIDHCLKNERSIKIAHINTEERAILSLWRNVGWLEGGASFDSLRVTKEFFDAMQEILWLGYVTYDGW